MAAPRSVIGAPSLGLGRQNPGQTIGAMPLFQPTTDYGTLAANSGRYGETPNGSGAEHVDQYGNRFKYVDYGNGEGEWLQVTQSGALVKPQDVAAAEQRDPFRPTTGANIQGTRSAGNSGATPDNNFFTPAGSKRPVSMQGTFGAYPQGGQQIVPQATPASSVPNYQAQFNDLLNDDIQSDNNWYTGQRERDDNYIGQLGNLVNGANASDLAAVGKYNSIVDPQIAAVQGLQAPTWTDYNSNPADVQRQLEAYDWAKGAAYGSLDYQAQLANYQAANYQTYQAQQAAYQRAQLYQAALERYNSNPEDIQGQKDAIAAIKADLARGGDNQRDAMEKYKALTSPEVTAQERYLAEIARRSFESQDRSSREAVLQDQAMRGMRSGGAEIASALGNQERLGQDRTLAELGLQANAVGRSMNALQGYSQSASSLRNSDLASMGLYVDATGRLRDANDRVGMFNAQQANTVNMFNADASNQNSMFNANAYNQNQQFNAEQNNVASQFNANAYNQNSMFNADAYNQNSMFNANSVNTARANNQSARVAGGVSMNNTANSIRQQNDIIGMFNTEGSQASKQFAATFGIQKANTLGNLAQTQFGNTTGVTQTNLGRSTGLAATDWTTNSAREAESRRLREEQNRKRGILLGGAADPMPSRSFPIPGVGV